MNSIKTANWMLIGIVVILVTTTVANMLSKKTIVKTESGEEEVATEFVGFRGKKSQKAA